jgi:alpha,alpha-trehalase
MVSHPDPEPEEPAPRAEPQAAPRQHAPEESARRDAATEDGLARRGSSLPAWGSRAPGARRASGPGAARASSPTRLDSPFPPIGDYGFLSDCHTGALVASDGSIEWMCLPHFDSPWVFGALLDRGSGRWRVGPYGVYVPAGRRYIPGTNMIETTWMTPQGWLRVVDALTIGDWHENERESSHTRPPTDFDADHLLVRMMECIQGEVQVELLCEPMLDHGTKPASWTPTDTGAEGGSALDARGGDTGFRLYSDLRMGIEGNRVHARHTMNEGERRYSALSWTETLAGPRTVDQAAEYLSHTSHFWRTWLAEGAYPDHPWRFHLQRSALVLKGLTFMPTGALVAAPTTSLPETPRGERNWDYRYCWMRDASFTLWALHALGLDWEADDFVQYVADVPRNEDGSLQIMYGIKGQSELTETTLDALTGYEGARPVRIGNGAYRQRQNDVYGAVLDSVYLHSNQRDHVPERLWPVLADQVQCTQRVWREPDQGIWEARGEPRHYVSSKLMCWVAMDRGARLAERRGRGELGEQWQALADEIRDDILDRGVDGRGVFRQHYETDALDASTLLVPLVRFLPPEDERVRATVMAIREELTENGLVLRYRTAETDDGLSGEEGTFLICSFWLVSALSEIGEHRAAEHLCERLLSYSSPLELYGEELEASSGRHLGNFPQAFTHLALINAVTHVIEAERQA